METTKLEDCVHFWVFPESHTRVSGAGAPDMGHVSHQNDILIKPYRDHKKNIDRKHFHFHGTHKTGWFFLFLNIFGLPHQGFRGGSPDMSHIMHQNDCLVKLFRYHKKKGQHNAFALPWKPQNWTIVSIFENSSYICSAECQYQTSSCKAGLVPLGVALPVW